MGTSLIFYKTIISNMLKKIKSKKPRNADRAREKTITKIVNFIVSSRDGQLTFFNSPRDSFKKVFRLEVIVLLSALS